MGLKFNEKAHRYTMTNAAGEWAPVTGATTLLGGGIPKPQLVYWAGKMVAEFVRDNPLEVERLRGAEDMVRELAKIPNQVRDRAAVRGTEIHAIAERVIAGEEVDPGEHVAEVQGYVDFLDAWDIQPVHTEVSVGNRTHWYSGRLDLIATSPHLADGKPILLDIKTSNGIYGETALQTAAYALAEFYVTDDDPDTEHPLPGIAATYVAHVTAAGTFLHELCPNTAEIKTAHKEFLAAAYVAKTKKARDARVKDPLPYPNTETERQAA